MTQICTPERAQIHAAINASITPAFGHVGLLETCEQLARYEADLLSRLGLVGIPDPAAYVAAMDAVIEAAEATVDRPIYPRIERLEAALQSARAAKGTDHA